MTSLLLHWLNEELPLHRKVDVLERDLCNGYVLAEILHLHGLEGHLERYTDSSDLSTRVSNLELLAKAMASGGLGELKAATKREILMENRSAIVQLLLHVKETLEARGKKVSVEKQKLMNVSSRVYEPRSPVKNLARVIQDVEERFVKETYKKYEPKEVRFYKDVNSAVHLRKFSQAQWQAENEQLEYEKEMAADKARQSANGMAALRAHLNEKRAFMKEWDKQRLDKWQHTQKLYQDAERDDLRLELTLEERKRRLHAAKLAEVQADAKDGVVGFEKNMNRLGLGGNNGGAAEPPLRAIPASDPGALAHFHRLEDRVEDLSFRPSNNVQMMKELRARRKAQLAAEKDRRLRRMKAISDAKKAAADLSSGGMESLDCGKNELMADTLSDTQMDPEAPNKPIVIQDAFIEANRESLEANYARLHEIGTSKREADHAELQRIRLEKRSKTRQRRHAECLEIVDDLVTLAIAARAQDDSGDEDALRKWKSEMWSELSRSKSIIGANESNRQSDEDDIRNLTDTFLSLSDVWGTFVGISEQVSSCGRFSTSALSDRIEVFVRRALAGSPDEVLSTVWTPLPEFQLVSLYSSDERGHAVARRAATDQSLHYVNVDELLEQCVKYTYDPVKQPDVVATLGDRERELGAFGSKITAFRQKSSPIPDSLVVDIVIAAVSLCQPKVPGPHEAELPDGSTPPQGEASGSDEAAVAIEPTGAPGCVGCLLHNFPKSAEEWKLFERLMDAKSRADGDDEAAAARASALEAVGAGETAQYVSTIAAAIVLSHWEPPQATPTPVLSPSSSGSELPSSASERKRADPTSSKRQSTVDPAIAKAEAELEALQKRQLVEELFSRTSRVVKIDQAEMHERVLQELVHLAVDVYTTKSAREQVGLVIECPSCVTLPEDMHKAREERRSSMPADVRIAWMVATKELKLNEQSLMEMVLRVRRLDDVRATNLRQLFGAAYEVLRSITQASRTKQHELDELLSHIAPQCKLTVEKASKLFYTNKPSQSEKLLTAVEVELGDAIDHRRLLAQRFIDQVEEESHSTTPPLLLQLVPWLQLLPRVCLELKEFVVDVMALLGNGLYEQFPFLRAESSQIFPVELPPHTFKAMEAAVESIDRSCADSGLRLSFLPEVRRLVEQIATPGTSETPSRVPSYDLAEERIASELVADGLRAFDAVLRWSAALVVMVKSTYASDVASMREYVSREVHSSSRTVARVIKELAVTGSAQWPQPSIGTTASTASALPRVSRHHQAAFLSTAQLERLVSELRLAEEASASQLTSLTREQFVATTFDVATRYGFPQPWQDAQALARVAVAWSSDAQAGRVQWRTVVFAMICMQFTGFPSAQDVSHVVSQVARPTDPLADQIITLDDFHSRLKLWFEHDRGAGGPTTRWKTLLFSLFADKSSPSQANVVAMILTFCNSPAYPTEVRSDLARSALPRSSRGLRRAFATLSTWPSTDEASVLGEAKLALLLRLAGMDVDLDQLVLAVAAHRNSAVGTIQPWRAHEVHDFLRFCDAFDSAIARRFELRNTLAALLDEDMA